MMGKVLKRRAWQKGKQPTAPKETPGEMRAAMRRLDEAFVRGDIKAEMYLALTGPSAAYLTKRRMLWREFRTYRKHLRLIGSWSELRETWRDAFMAAMRQVDCEFGR